MSPYDWAQEFAIEQLRYEAIMKNATLHQCIYLFVEGESEEQAIPILLENAGLDLQKLGIVVANYNGIGNLSHVLRLMKRTLSHDRPIIATYDNDIEGAAFTSSVYKLGLDLDLVSFFPIPSEPIVCYADGHKGGAFEEAFTLYDFINTSLTDFISEGELSSVRSKLIETFDSSKPWDAQIARFLHAKGHAGFSSRKTNRAVALADSCSIIPETFTQLASAILKIRDRNLITHPDDVSLPKIPGLTI
jgi:hypothetical protein